MSRTRELLAALESAQAGGYLAQPPGLDGEQGLGIAGVSSVPRARTWDAVASARAGDLTGDTVAFVALSDGTLIVDEDVPDGSLTSLAEAIEELVEPPYRAAALRGDGDVWTVVAEAVTIVELPHVAGDVIDLSSYSGTRELTVDGERATQRVPALDTVMDEHGDVAIHAERIDGDHFAVDVFPL